MSDLDPAAKASGATPTVAGDTATDTFWKKVIAFALNVKQGLDSLRGLNDPQDAAVTWRALAQLGLVTTNGNGRKVWKGGIIRHGNVTIGLPSGQSDSTSPPIPLNFAATAAISTSILSWTEPDYSNHSFTEVWRNTSNSLTGATMIGISTSTVYADNVGVTSGTRYYWIRHVSTAGIIGPYQSSSGTANTTLQIGAADIQALCITNALISNTAAIDSAKIASLTADKITAGTITSQTVTLGNNSSSIIKSANYSAGSAGWQIRGDGVAEFQNVTVRGSIDATDITAGTLSVARVSGNSISRYASSITGSLNIAALGDSGTVTVSTVEGSGYDFIAECDLDDTINDGVSASIVTTYWLLVSQTGASWTRYGFITGFSSGSAGAASFDGTPENYTVWVPPSIPFLIELPFSYVVSVPGSNYNPRRRRVCGWKTSGAGNLKVYGVKITAALHKR